MKRLLILSILLGIMSVSLNLFLQEPDLLSEEKAKKLANRYKPIIIFDSSEEYFPAAIEWFNINWSNATLNDPNTQVEYSYKGPSSLDKNAPMYVSVLQNNGTIRISYSLLYAYNGCGPYLKAKINTIFGFNLDQNIKLCPMGLHQGDIERISIFLNEDSKQIIRLEYAYHDFVRELLPEEVKFVDNRPTVYIAPGSHASYPTCGEQEYLNAWIYSVNSVQSKGYVTDNIEHNHHYKWKDYKIRLLKLNGQPTSYISQEESYLAFLFKGRLGAPIENSNFDIFFKEMSAYAQILKTMNTKAYEYVMLALGIMRSEVEKKACFSLAGPGRENWW